MSLNKKEPCRYGAKCYQKNSWHNSKYTHPPREETTEQKTEEVVTGIKRKNSLENDKERAQSESPQRKLQKIYESFKGNLHNPSLNLQNNLTNNENKESSNIETHTHTEVLDKNVQATHVLMNECHCSFKPNEHNTVENISLSYVEAKKIITDLFLVEMPEDFYLFYDFCKSISKDKPLLACKSVCLELVGPYDVLDGKIKNSEIQDNKEKYLIHWRYYYDLPEFQTIIKCHDKEGLHFGYWRDDIVEKPVFVAKNRGNVNCIFEPVAENIFGVVDIYLQNKVKSANLFEKSSIICLHSQLKNFAKQHNITLEKNTANMRSRERNVVARTLHKAGIVVPYDKKTQLGYRDLVATDDDLQKILKQIEKASTSDERNVPIAKLNEIVRMATIAADECDFGTCLELGHDLFSNGSIHVQSRALQMLSIAYTHLQRPQMLKILKTHLKDRRKGSELSVI